MIKQNGCYVLSTRKENDLILRVNPPPTVPKLAHWLFGDILHRMQFRNVYQLILSQQSEVRKLMSHNYVQQSELSSLWIKVVQLWGCLLMLPALFIKLRPNCNPDDVEFIHNDVMNILFCRWTLRVRWLESFCPSRSSHSYWWKRLVADWVTTLFALHIFCFLWNNSIE